LWKSLENGRTMKEQKRKKICDIAAKLFAERGFESTTTRDISKAAGMSDAGVYYYFDSKELLLYQILDETLSMGLDLIKKIDQSDKTPGEKLGEITRLYTQYYAFDINRVKLLVEEQKSLSSAHRHELDEKQREYLDILVKVLEALKDQGEMVSLDTSVCAFAFFGMVHWVYRWFKPNGRIRKDQLAEIFNQIFIKGIGRFQG
jgi:AcrR family transcriptional regulator